MLLCWALSAALYAFAQLASWIIDHSVLLVRKCLRYLRGNFTGRRRDLHVRFGPLADSCAATTLILVDHLWSAAVWIRCSRKKRSISRVASGPRGSVKEPAGLPPDHA
jgi:hypothetical protein